MKRVQALIAATIITGLIALGMLAIGVNAALNPNSVVASNAPGDPPLPTVTAGSATSSQTQAEINQLQNLVAQYQNREKQYQAELNQANSQLQQYQAVLAELQRIGLIRVNSDGSIQLRSRGFGFGDNGGG